MLQGRGVQTSVIQTRISGSQKNLFHPLNNLSIKYLNYTKTAGFDPVSYLSKQPISFILRK